MAGLFRNIIVLSGILSALAIDDVCSEGDDTCSANVVGLSLLQSKMMTHAVSNKNEDITPGMAQLSAVAERGTCETLCVRKVEKGARTWEELCTWDQCSACDDCATTTTTTTTTLPANCESYCANRVEKGTRTWETLCTWDSCMGCDDCAQITTTTTTTATTATTSVWQSPFFAMKCNSTQIRTTEWLTFDQYDAAVSSVESLYNSLSDTCTPTYCPQADFAGCVLRIAGHDFMDYKDREGGSDGCIDFHDGDNAGLAECIHTGEHGVALADAYVDFCTSISLADYFVIAAEAVMKLSRLHTLADDPTRSEIDFRSKFKWGRTTALTCEFAEGRLPNPENSCSAVEETFVNSMGLTWGESAALMGVHTLGRASIANSGYNGWWSDAENSRKFNNDYFVSIVLKGWAPEPSVNGNPAKNQWRRVDSGVDETKLGKEMMLNTDMCLFYTMDDAGEVELDAATGIENECNCTWASAIRFSPAIENYNNGQFCGSTAILGASDFPGQRALCCGEEFDVVADQWVDCGLPISPQGPAAADVARYANNEDAWIRDFKKAWTIATTNGFDSLRTLRSA